MVTHISHSPLETEGLGETWGRSAETGLVIALCGDLGAGKTQLVRGLARGLGITERPHSPTFALINIYGGGRLALFHLDLYRLESRAQFVAAGLEEYLAPAGVTVIEWAERWFGVFGSPESGVQSPKSWQMAKGEGRGSSGEESPPAAPGSGVKRLRWVQIETLSETERRITYEDFGA
jgi:tRNA threonylcarbamoyladenosine biosynthesis protein TsaE